MTGSPGRPMYGLLGCLRMNSRIIFTASDSVGAEPMQV